MPYIAIVGGLILLVNMGPGKCVDSIVRFGAHPPPSRRSVGRREEEDVLSVFERRRGVMHHLLIRTFVDVDVDVARVCLPANHLGRKDPGTMGQLVSVVSFAKTWRRGFGLTHTVHLVLVPCYRLRCKVACISYSMTVRLAWIPTQDARIVLEP